MSKRLIYYHPSVLEHLAHERFPGVRALSSFRVLFNNSGTKSHMLVDRTGTIRSPVRTASLFPIPAFRPMHKTYEELCNERAIELLELAEKLGIPLQIFWSGGIDSTLVLISLLKNCTPEQKGNMVVLMTEHSIAENPNFYRDHIRGKLPANSSAMAPYLIGANAIITNGEPNDPIFGMGTAGRMMQAFGPAIIHQPYRRETLFEFFNASVHDEAITDRYLDLFDRLMQTSPVPITTYFDYIWWINFTLKWQFASLKLITAASKHAAPNITPEYMRSRFAPFYGTDEFQLWSMNNMDKKIKNEWRTFKWVCKDIIYEYTKDAAYRDNKIKTGSMRHIFSADRAFKYIDDSMHFYDKLDPHEFYEPENDFV